MGITSKAAFLFIMILLVLITGCTPNSATVLVATKIVNSTEIHPTIAPTEVPITSPNKLDSIHLRIEFQTTSDWSDLTFMSPETVLEVKIISKEGDLSEYEITSERASLSQSSANAEKGNLVGVTYDLHLDPEAISNPQFVLLERGDINTSTVKIYHVHDEDPILLQEVIHNRMVLDQLGRNPHHFVLDLSPIYDQIDE